jgi:coronin-1B/1C/6
MAKSFVRQSKYRHVFANVPKRDDLWEGVKLTKNAWDSNWVTASGKWVAVAWQTGGGGAIGILDAKRPGKLEPTQVPLISGHKGAILDLEFDPFNDDMIATASEDCTAKLWRIPSEGLAASSQLTEDVQTLKGHKKKVGVVRFHPVVENLIATAGQDYEVKVWDIERGAAIFTTLGHENLIQSLDWNYDGSLLCSNAKDKRVRVIDPRTQSVVTPEDQGHAHVGVKGGRALWMGKHDKLASVGFGSGASREFMLWDAKNMAKPLYKQTLDNAAGVIIPFYDEDADLLFLAGKGDGAIKYFEIAPEEEPGNMCFEGSAYRTNDPTSGCGAVHRRHCNISANEIIRLYQVTGTQVRPLSFQVPRKSDLFQPDLFPPCRGDTPNLDLASWVGGANATPALVDLENGFVATERAATSFSKVADAGPADTASLQAKIASLEADLAAAHSKIRELEARLG